MLFNTLRLFLDPNRAWIAIRDARYSLAQCVVFHTAVLALIPALAGYVGTTRTGWSIGAGEPVRLTEASAMRIAILYYLAMLAGTLSVGWTIHWMTKTYGAHQPLSQCYALATFTATPLFVAGLAQLYPVLWVDLVIGLPVLGYTIYLFFTGLPTMMRIPPERAFLFGSAVMAFGLVALVAMLAVSVLLWSSGFGPAYAG